MAARFSFIKNLNHKGHEVTQRCRAVGSQKPSCSFVTFVVKCLIPMPRQSEALILRTYPFHEADLLVTFFTRTEGKIRGVAKAAKRSKRRFGGALEPLTHVSAHWAEKQQ